MTRMLTWVFLLIACSWQVTAQSVTNTATGIVKNDKGAGMEGVTVRLENASNGFKNITSTNSRGVFSFSNVPVGSDYRFIISSVGYDSDTLTGYEMKENGRISLAVVLQPKNSSLESLVVIGYGAMRKKDLSAAVSTVPDMAQIKERPVLDALTMIQGKVPGVTIVSNGGHPDQGPTLYIRGTGSRNGDAPLVCC